jgi:hypothetical protein
MNRRRRMPPAGMELPPGATFEPESAGRAEAAKPRESMLRRFLALALACAFARRSLSRN